MRQFYKVYRADEKVTPLVTQLLWTDNFINLSQCKRPEDRDFNLRLAVQERWGKREPERQFRFGAFERASATPLKVSAALTQIRGPDAPTAFKEAYALEFLVWPATVPRPAVCFPQRTDRRIEIAASASPASMRVLTVTLSARSQGGFERGPDVAGCHRRNPVQCAARGDQSRNEARQRPSALGVLLLGLGNASRRLVLKCIDCTMDFGDHAIVKCLARAHRGNLERALKIPFPGSIIHPGLPLDLALKDLVLKPVRVGSAVLSLLMGSHGESSRNPGI